MEIEFAILDMIQHIRTPIGDAVMSFVSMLGNAGIVWILLAIILIIVPETRKHGVVLVIALLINAILCNVILKNLFHRTRPCDINTAIKLLIARPVDFSFPSGHTSVSFAAVSALFFSGKRRLWKPALVLAVLIAFSRMYLYVHFPTDILGGIVVGVVAGYLAGKIYNGKMKGA